LVGVLILTSFKSLLTIMEIYMFGTEILCNERKYFYMWATNSFTPICIVSFFLAMEKTTLFDNIEA
jgi:hypothetical protein